MDNDDVIKWKDFSASLALCSGNSPVTGEFHVTKVSDAELWCFRWSRTNCWPNTRIAGDLRRHRAHYDVTVLTVHQIQPYVRKCIRRVGDTAQLWTPHYLCMMTSWNGNIFRVTGHLCGEFTGPRWILHTKASNAVLWCYLWSASESTVEETIVRLVIWNAIAPIMTSS